MYKLLNGIVVRYNFSLTKIYTESISNFEFRSQFRKGISPRKKEKYIILNVKYISKICMYLYKKRESKHLFRLPFGVHGMAYRGNF